MALYQPTNVIPSSYTKGTVDVNDTMEISWQVNGNSAMTAFQIDFYLNDANSTYVTSTGRLEDNCPFYGTDRFGRPQFFTWNAGEPWKVFDGSFTNGNEYKYKITQWYKDNPLVGSDLRTNTHPAMESNKLYYFRPYQIIDGVRQYIGYVSFSTNNENIKFMSGNPEFYYDFTNQKGWFVSDDNILHLIPMTVSQTFPTGAIEFGIGNVLARTATENFVQQISSNIFIAQEIPTLTIYRSSTDDYLDKIDFPNNGSIASSIGFFKAVYYQDQDIPIRWIRWQVATATFSNEQWSLGDILQDTGDIYTPTLNFEFNGFFNNYDKDGNYTGNGYAIRAIGESESGQECNSNPNTDGWIFFNINIKNQGEYLGEFTVQCLKAENATLLEWEGVEVIPPTVSPENYQPTISNGSVTLLPKDGETEYSVTWDKQIVIENGESKIISLDFKPNWTIVYQGKIGGIRTEVTTVEVTPTKIIYDENVMLFTISGQTVTTADGYVYPVNLDAPGYVYDIQIIRQNSNVKNIDVTYVDRVGKIGGLIYSYLRGQTVEVSVQVTYTNRFSGTSTIDFAGNVIDSKITSNDSPKNTVANISDVSNKIYVDIIQTGTYLSAVNSVNIGVEAEIWSVGNNTSPQGILAEKNDNIFIDRQNSIFNINLSDSKIISIEPVENSNHFNIIINPNFVYMMFYRDTTLLRQIAQSIEQEDWQTQISSIKISGGDSGTTVESVSIYQGDGSNILSLYANPDFEPVWNDPNYDLYMTANFNGNLEGGTGTATGRGFRIYRQEIGKNYLQPIATVPSTMTSLKDYGIVSRKAYKYSLYAYDNNGAFMSAVENEKVIATCFKNYSLLVCDYDEENDEYHVRKQYLFALNLSTGSVGNNNSPTLNANFTRYPTRMPSTQNYASGTLQGLIGAIYTVPALIEQIGNYKWTAKPSTMDYFDSVDLEQELYDLSTAPYQLFLRDMKGRLRMIATNSAITMTTNIKQKQQSISISFPWVEVGDASDVTIIQTPDDYGWNNDNQILDVSLDVDAATGELSATYPFPYNGTKFYLTGVSKETLMAKTPFGVTPAQFDLSETTTETDDGELTATVKVNSEES